MSKQHAPAPTPLLPDVATKYRKIRRNRAVEPRLEDYPLGLTLNLERRERNGYREYMRGQIVSSYRDKRFTLGWGRNGDIAVFVKVDAVEDAHNAHLIGQIVPLYTEHDGSLFMRGVHERV